MTELASYYAKLLAFGLLNVREAVSRNDIEWAKAEADFLHNIPSLLDETNVKRHRYFWREEREAYIGWVNESGSDEARKRMRMFYDPVWQEMQAMVQETLSGDRIAT